MPMYDYPDDGRFHTRYSEIVKCQTPRGAITVARERLKIKDKISTKATEFGSLRHDMWDQESKETGKTPDCFAKALGKQWTTFETEKHRATELFDNIVVHFTTDAVVIPSDIEDDIMKMMSSIGKVDVVDYKTGTGNRKEFYTKYYQNQLQLPAYALLLRPHGMNVITGHYLIECWDADRDNLEGYIYVEKKISLIDMAQAKQMFKKGIQNLLAAEAAVKKEFGL